MTHSPLRSRSRSPKGAALAAALASLALPLSLASAQQTPAAPQAQPQQPATEPPTAPSAPAVPLPTLDEVVDKFHNAIGGSEALDKATSFTLKGTLSMPGAGLSGAMMIWCQPPLLATTMELPGMGTFRSGFDGTVGWTENPLQGTTLMDAADIENFKKESSAGIGADIRELYDTVKVTGFAPFEGKRCVVVAGTKGDNSTTQYFDCDSGLLLGSHDKVKTSMGSMEATSIVSDYKKFGDILIATRIVIKVMGQQQVMEFSDCSFAPIDPSTFALPPEVQTLVKQRDAKAPTEQAPATAPAAGTAP